MLAPMLCGCHLEILNSFLKGPFILVLHWAHDLYGQSCMESLLTLLSEFKKKRASPLPCTRQVLPAWGRPDQRAA